MHSTTTKVEVLQQTGQSEGGFDPRGIYERESPGVVTVIATGLATPGSSSSAGLGSWFVLSGEGEIATNAHVVTSGEGPDIRKASNVFVRFADGNQVRAAGGDASLLISMASKSRPIGPPAATSRRAWRSRIRSMALRMLRALANRGWRHPQPDVLAERGLRRRPGQPVLLAVQHDLGDLHQLVQA